MKRLLVLLLLAACLPAFAQRRTVPSLIQPGFEPATDGTESCDPTRDVLSIAETSARTYFCDCDYGGACTANGFTCCWNKHPAADVEPAGSLGEIQYHASGTVLGAVPNSQARADNTIDVDGLRAKGIPFYDVTHKDFGAVGDDATPDQVAINAAFDAAETAISGAPTAGEQGAVVFFPKGTYEIDSQVTLTIPSPYSVGPLYIVGEGAVIKASASYSGDPWMMRLTSNGLSARHVFVHGISFHGDDKAGVRGLQIDAGPAGGFFHGFHVFQVTCEDMAGTCIEIGDGRCDPSTYSRANEACVIDTDCSGYPTDTCQQNGASVFEFELSNIWADCLGTDTEDCIVIHKQQGGGNTSMEDLHTTGGRVGMRYVLGCGSIADSEFIKAETYGLVTTCTGGTQSFFNIDVENNQDTSAGAGWLHTGQGAWYGLTGANSTENQDTILELDIGSSQSALISNALSALTQDIEVIGTNAGHVIVLGGRGTVLQTNTNAKVSRLGTADGTWSVDAATFSVKGDANLGTDTGALRTVTIGGSSTDNKKLCFGDDDETACLQWFANNAEALAFGQRFRLTGSSATSPLEDVGIELWDGSSAPGIDPVGLYFAQATSGVGHLRLVGDDLRLDDSFFATGQIRTNSNLLVRSTTGYLEFVDAGGVCQGRILYDASCSTGLFVDGDCDSVKEAGENCLGAGGGTPGGSPTHVQYHDTGGSFAGDAGMTYDATGDRLTLGGGVRAGNAKSFEVNSGNAWLEYNASPIRFEFDAAVAGNGALAVNGDVTAFPGYNFVVGDGDDTGDQDIVTVDRLTDRTFKFDDGDDAWEFDSDVNVNGEIAFYHAVDGLFNRRIWLSGDIFRFSAGNVQIAGDLLLNTTGRAVDFVNTALRYDATNDCVYDDKNQNGSKDTTEACVSGAVETIRIAFVDPPSNNDVVGIGPMGYNGRIVEVYCDSGDQGNDQTVEVDVDICSGEDWDPPCGTSILAAKLDCTEAGDSEVLGTPHTFTGASVYSVQFTQSGSTDLPDAFRMTIITLKD